MNAFEHQYESTEGPVSSKPHEDDDTGYSTCTTYSALPEYQDDSEVDYSVASPVIRRERTLTVKNVGLYGRSKETSMLNEVFLKAKTSRQLVLLEGAAGSGKSALVQAFQRKVATSRGGGGLYGSGNYTLTQNDEPYAAIAQACNQLCLELTGNLKVKSRLRKEFKSHSESFFRIVPGVESLMGVTTVIEETGEDTANVDVERLDERNQLHQSFRQFFQILGSGNVVVLSIDNLHWADQSSLDLIEHLLSDRENQALMVVACYRDTKEVVSVTDHPLTQMARRLATIESLNTTRIVVGNLSVAAVDSMLVDICYTDSDRGPDTNMLAEVIHAKTSGNPFHSLQFIASLGDEKLLVFSEVKAKWTWDLDKIKSSTAATANVIELLQHKLQRLEGSHTSSLMQLAACLGTTIHRDMFQVLVDDFCKHSNDGTYLIREERESYLRPEIGGELAATETLRIAEQEGMVKRIDDSDTYRWVHDNLQESAYLLLPKHRRCQIQLHLGCLLKMKLEPSRLEDNLYRVLRLLNAGSDALTSTDTSLRVQIAELNMTAGRRSIDASSFTSANMYFLKAIQLLPSNHWSVLTALSLNLYSSAAEAEYCIGSMEAMEKHCREVISRDNVSLLQKKRAYTTLIVGLNAQGKLEEALKLCCVLLAKLACPIPKRLVLVRVIPGFLRAKGLVDDITSVNLCDLKIMTNPEQLWTMVLLDRLFNIAILANKPELSAAAIVKSFQYTTKHGASEETPAAIARMGYALSSSLGESVIGRAYSDYALRLLEVFDNKRVMCRTYCMVFGLIHHQTDTLVAEPLLRGYETGMAAGDTENACWNIYFYIVHSWHLGVPLAQVAKAAAKYIHKMKELGQEQPAEYTNFIKCGIETLMASDQARPLITSAGETMGDLEAANTVESDLVLFTLRAIQMYQYFIYNDFEHLFQIRKHLNEVGFETALPGAFMSHVFSFFNGLAAFSLFRQTKKRMYKKIGATIRRRMKSCMKNGNSNIINQVALLDAEWSELKQDYNTSIICFQTSIAVAGERGATQEHAIAEQRYGEFLLRRGDHVGASTHLVAAGNMFGAWGAHGKVKHLTKQYPQFLGDQAFL